MSRKLVISTFNWQNDFYRPKFNLLRTCNIFIDFVLDNEIDILGLQETVRARISLCLPKLRENGYNFYGEGRFSGEVSKVLFSVSNEDDMIFTRFDIGNSETINLPSGFFLPRTINKVVCSDFVIFNTHLSLFGKNKMRQLDILYHMIRYEVKNLKKVIVVGDFNMTIYNKDFSKFIAKLGELGIKRVLADELTCKGVKAGPIDHVFVPSSWEVLDIDYKDLPISDHRAIVVKVNT